MAKHLVLVAGNIGSGKTSLTERIGSRLGWRNAFESVSDNPYLPDFYQEMAKWSFHLQVFFLGHRAEQHLEMANDPRSAIIDRSIYEDAFIFARALHDMGNISERDFNTYQKIYQMVVRTLPAPSLLVFLYAPVDILIERIKQRGRSIETGISPDYLCRLELYYHEWLQSFDLCPVFTIKTNDLDFVHKPKHFELVVKRIQEKLTGKEEMVFTE
ncbi:MAG: deoxynucleoside kinase [Chloroflexi bacterium HGW-Chloroflexi-8]|jgi:deoxyadenosine/deoxycytidine kinase|nr:MAG: deoxynucleoside kinase [Chloroflexi bacterium HGW-Chloroflexi-8]